MEDQFVREHIEGERGILVNSVLCLLLVVLIDRSVAEYPDSGVDQADQTIH